MQDDKIPHSTSVSGQAVRRRISSILGNLNRISYDMSECETIDEPSAPSMQPNEFVKVVFCGVAICEDSEWWVLEAKGDNERE